MIPFSRVVNLLVAPLVLAVIARGGGAEPTVAQAPSDGGQAPSMNIAVVFLDQPPDPLQAGWLALPTGLSETLFKLGKDFSPEPWLATGAQQIDEKT